MSFSSVVGLVLAVLGCTDQWATINSSVLGHKCLPGFILGNAPNNIVASSALTCGVLYYIHILILIHVPSYTPRRATTR